MSSSDDDSDVVGSHSEPSSSSVTAVALIRLDSRLRSAGFLGPTLATLPVHPLPEIAGRLAEVPKLVVVEMAWRCAPVAYRYSPLMFITKLLR